ncbi:hypothetical protein QL285_076755 [Trifolium repens]|nr:hypothetical protein QL285_076755 [Trifolium repens]
MPFDIDLNQIYNNESPTDFVQIDLNVCPPCEEEANVDLNINPSYEENNVDLNLVSSYEGEEGTNDLMNLVSSYVDIRLICQPPNSPDLNVMDLGFFNSIQSLQQKEVTKSVDELIQVVENAFEAYDCKSSNKIFLSLQSSMLEIMKKK